MGKDTNYREKYDVSVSRAVAPLNILLEYLVPFVKENGKILCMKGPNINEEINNSENALKELYSTIYQVDKILIGDMERNILLVRKNKITNNKYPRNAGIPSKKPL